MYDTHGQQVTDVSVGLGNEFLCNSKGQALALVLCMAVLVLSNHMLLTVLMQLDIQSITSILDLGQTQCALFDR